MKFHRKVNYTCLLFILTFSFFSSIYSQDLLMQNGTANTCTGNFYDSGGPNGSYGSNEDFTYTICPDILDYKLVVEFIEIGITSAGGNEELIIYDGSDTSANILTILDSSNNINTNDSPVIVVASENNASGCLTFKFTSNGFFNNIGWNAMISCIEECIDTTATLSQVIPSTFNTVTTNNEVVIFENISIEIAPVFADNNGDNPEYIWDFGDGTAPVVSNIAEISHVFENFGVFNVSVSITDDFGCSNDDVIQIPVEVVTPSGSLCSEATRICLDNSSIILPNFNPDNGGLPNAEAGPDYGCLGAQPYPGWFYFQVEDSGDIAFLLEQNDTLDFTGVNLDLDFKIWGPFTNAFGNCDNLNASTEVPDLPSGNQFDGCSFSASPGENMGIQNATAGEYYFFMTTNFSQQQGFIKITQTNSSDVNAGSIACNDNEFLGNDITACVNDSVTITATIDNADSYLWELFNPATNTFEVIPNEQSSTLSINNPGGTFRCTVTSGTNVNQDEITVTLFEEPIINQTPFDIIGCTDNSTTTIDLTINSLQSLGVVNPGNFEIYYYESQSDANTGDISLAIPEDQTNNYNVTLSPITLFLRVQNISNSDCYTITSFTAEVSQPPNVSPQPDLVICDDGDDGFEFFDLSVATPNITENLQNVTVSYYETENDAISNLNQIVNVTNYGNITNPQTIFFRVVESNNPCITVDSINLVVDDCLSIDENTLTTADIKIYPVPANDKIIFIESNKFANSSSKVKITDLNGKIVYTASITFDSSGKSSLRLSSLISGIYLAIIEIDKTSIVNKIILK